MLGCLFAPAVMTRKVSIFDVGRQIWLCYRGESVSSKTRRTMNGRKFQSDLSTPPLRFRAPTPPRPKRHRSLPS